MRDTSLRVLYLHPAASFGGASKSLVELFSCLQGRGVEGVVLSPVGTASEAFVRAGMALRPVRGLSQFDNTRYGFYRKLRWIILLRELFLLPSSLSGLWRLRGESYDLIHINEITLLPVGVVAKWLLRVPLVVHVRSLQRKPGSGWRTGWINGLLRRYADLVVAIDHTVAASLEADLPVRVIHNGLTVNQKLSFSSAKSDQDLVRVGFLGVLIPLKGVFELIQAMRLLKQRGVQVECVIAGENARHLSGIKAWILGKLGFARDVRAELEALIRREGLESHVKLLGFVQDVRELYPQLDILCFPSHLDAAGRPVFEAAFYSVPSVVAVSNPMPDALLHEVTGLAVPTPDPKLIADALQRLVKEPEFRRQLGRQAKVWAEETFAIDANAARMLDLYRHVLSSTASR